MVDRFDAFPYLQESRRAIVRLRQRAASAYMAQGVYATMNTTVRRLANHTLRSVVNQREIETSFAARFGMSDMAALITGDVVSIMAPNVAQLAELFAKGLSSNVNRKVGLLAVHREAALAAQAAVQDAYRTLVLDQQKVPSYRENQGRLPGKLAEALARPDFKQATIDGVFFANVAMLDQVAAHWRRLNFGAGAAGGTTPPAPAFGIKFFNEAVGTLQLDFGPRPSFVIPPGIFVRSGFTSPDSRGSGPATFQGTTAHGFDASRRGLDAFYLPSMASGLGITKVRGPLPTGPVATRGIVGRRFIDAGLGVLANTLPYLYEQKIREWLELASKETGRRGPFGPLLQQAEAVALKDSAIAARHANQFLRV